GGVAPELSASDRSRQSASRARAATVQERRFGGSIAMRVWPCSSTVTASRVFSRRGPNPAEPAARAEGDEHGFGVPLRFDPVALLQPLGDQQFELLRALRRR